MSELTSKRAIIDDLMSTAQGKLSDLLSSVQDKFNPHYQSLKNVSSFIWQPETLYTNNWVAGVLLNPLLTGRQ